MIPPPESDILNEDPEFSETTDGRRRRLDFLGYAPCPVRNEMRRRLHRRIQLARREGARGPEWFVPAGCHSPNPYDEIWRETDFDALPALISEMGFGDFTRPEFVQRWITRGEGFDAVATPRARPEFQEAGLIDPRGFYHVYAVNPEVLLIDRSRLGDRPMPRSWADVLNPRFRGEVIISGEEGDIHETTLFSLHRMFGESALEALGANVRDFWHPAEMAKAAGAGNPKGAAIYILPWFFARGTPRREQTAIVWPEEGALAGLLYFLKKRESGPGARLPLEFLVGEEWTAFLEKAGFPAVASSARLPGRLTWAGWDYVQTHDLEALKPVLNAAFARGRRK